MSAASKNWGGVPVGHVAALDPIAAGAVYYFRLWFSGDATRAEIQQKFNASLGKRLGENTLNAFEQLCDQCTRYGRRPLMYHNVNCSCVGADESCFANFIACAAEGNREDAVLIATHLVRPDIAMCLVDLAQTVGIGLGSMAPSFEPDQPVPPKHTFTLH